MGKMPMPKYEKLEEVKGEVMREGGVLRGDVFRLLSSVEGDWTLRRVAKLYGVPVGEFTDWYLENCGGDYERALRVRGELLAEEVKGLVDRAEGGSIQALKLKVNTYLRLAGYWSRRYSGKEEGVGVGVPVLQIVVRGPGGEEKVVVGGEVVGEVGGVVK